ncbi:MAG: hypothetical protein AAFQ23_02680, partial [Cyanobacteria bacterium J06623_1]
MSLQSLPEIKFSAGLALQPNSSIAIILAILPILTNGQASPVVCEGAATEPIGSKLLRSAGAFAPFVSQSETGKAS